MACRQVVILVETGFVATELALVMDSLRIANRLGDQEHFKVEICSPSDNVLIESLGGGMLVRATPFEWHQSVPPDHVVVLGGRGICQSLGRQSAKLRWLERIGSHIILLSDAAYEWKLLHGNDGAFTTHWENQQLLRDTLVDMEQSPPLYTRTGRITTAAGMVSTSDVILAEIVTPISKQLAQATGHMLVMNGMRDGTASQPRSALDTQCHRVGRLDAVIRHMEQNIESPARMAELARIAGTSVRQLERRFEKVIGQTPVAFYRSLRLQRSRVMVEQTSTSISEIGIACGCSGAAAFARVFKREFGQSPSQLRQQLIARSSSSPIEKEKNHAPVTLSAPASRTSSNPSGAYGASVEGAWG